MHDLLRNTKFPFLLKPYQYVVRPPRHFNPWSCLSPSRVVLAFNSNALSTRTIYTCKEFYLGLDSHIETLEARAHGSIMF